MRSQFLLPGLVWALATLSPAAEITGRVLSERTGVVGATVAAVPYETRYAVALRETRGETSPAPLATATTSADGRFKLVVAQTAPPFVIRASFGGLATRVLDGMFEKADSEDVGEISLGSAETVSGRVLDEGGKPVAGAVVRIGRDGIPVSTGKDGLFRIDDVAGRGAQGFIAAPQVLSIHATGFEVQAAAVRFSGPPLTVKLRPSAARVTGSLKDSGGKPVVDAVVRLIGDVTTRWVRTDAAGHFDIPGAPSRQSRVQALSKDGSSLETVVAAANATYTLSRAASIEGRVTELETGKLVPGVKVTARATGASVVARSGVDGRYRLTGLPQGTYRISFDEKRFVLADRRNVELLAGEVKTLDLALTQAVTLVGRVSDEKGRPVAGARGTLSPGAESRMATMFRTMGREDEGGRGFVSGPDGSFKAARLGPGTNQKLSVVHPDFERRVISGVDLIAGVPKPLSVDVVLSAGFVLAGTVKDRDGQPIAGAEVAVNRSVRLQGGSGTTMVSFATIEAPRPQVETDFEGKFSFKGLPAGEYDVTVSKSGFTRSVSNGVKTGEGSSPLDLVLNPGASITGRLVQPTGAPVTGYSVSARPSGPQQGGPTGMIGGRGNNMTQTDPDGAFTLEGLVPGTGYDLSLFGAGEFRGDAKKKNVVAPASDIEIEVAARGRIAGRVLDAATGAPLTEFEARYSLARAGGGMQIVVRTGGEGDRRTPFSSPEGAFAFEDVPPGNWDVTVWAKTYQEARTGGVAVAAGETKTVEVKAARGLVIRGRVVDTKTGRGVQDASVSARAGGGGGPTILMFDASGEGGSITDADGRFEITGQSAGVYQLTARHSLFSEGTARVTLEDKDATIDIPVLGGGTIAGLVTSSQGAPLSGADVSLQGGEGGGMGFGIGGQNALTDGAGRFRFEHLSAGRYKVGASLRTEASPVIDVPLNAGDVREDIRLALDSGATLRGTVVGLPDAERTGVMVSAQGSQGYFGNARTGPEGSFEFSGVPKGTLTLRATAGDLMLGSSHTAVKEVAIPEGQLEVTADIVFEDGLSISGTVMRRGVPVVGARVSAFMSGTGRQASARVDENGNFKISGLEPGRVNVTAFAEDFSSQVSQIVELKSDTSVDLVIPTARLAGTVVDSLSSLPLESSVELQQVSTTPSAPTMRLSTTTDSSGRFAFDDLEPVDYRLTARRSSYESVTKVVKPSDAGEDLRLELKRGSGLAIEARDAQMGFGLRSLFVRVSEGTTDVFAGSVTLDGEGKGEIPGLPPGAYSVTAQASGYAPVRVPRVMAPSSALRLSFTPGGTVEFRTTEDFLAGGPKSGQLVSLTGSPVGMGLGGPNSFRLSRLTQRMENLAPGSYRLTLDGGVAKTFEISEGGIAIVTVP